jgi:hypothetical protein
MIKSVTFCNRKKITAGDLWDLVKGLLNDRTSSYLIIDDSAQNKEYSRKIELVKQQYSGATGGLVRGIGVVNLVHSDGTEFFPIDYRIYAPEVDGKTKNDHFREMVLNAKTAKQLQAPIVLFDAWYASVDNLKLLKRLGFYFVTTLKANRLVSLSKTQGYVHLETIEWTAEQLQVGIVVKLKELPFHVRLFKLVAPNGDIDWVIAYLLDDSLTVQVVTTHNDVRWQIEQLHRELKQLTGSERCQARKARSQRTHLACCYLAWLALKVKASQLAQSLYRTQQQLFDDYLRWELRHPRIPAYL